MISNRKLLMARMLKRASLPWSIELGPWSFLAQENEPTSDGNPDENKGNNCGEVCIAETLSYLYEWDFADYGPFILPDDIKDIIRPGETNLGPTSIDQMQGYLSDNWSVGSTSIATSGPNSLLWNEWTYLKSGKPLIALRYWRYPGDKFLHFVNVIGMNPTQVIIANPEPLDAQKVPLPTPTVQQMRQVESYAAHAALSVNRLIGIDGFSV